MTFRQSCALLGVIIHWLLRVEMRLKSWLNTRQLLSIRVGDMGACSLSNLCAKSTARLRLVSRAARLDYFRSP
jgi:hypothetical protein